MQPSRQNHYICPLATLLKLKVSQVLNGVHCWKGSLPFSDRQGKIAARAWFGDPDSNQFLLLCSLVNALVRATSAGWGIWGQLSAGIVVVQQVMRGD
jgi:hypothetical protein